MDMSGRAKGGIARAAALSPETSRRIAQKAPLARWGDIRAAAAALPSVVRSWRAMSRLRSGLSRRLPQRTPAKPPASRPRECC